MKRRAPGPARTDLRQRPPRPRHCAGDSGCMHDHPGQPYAAWGFIRRAVARVVAAA